MSPVHKHLLINSTITFVAAFVMTTIIHECGHFLTYAALGVPATLHHNYVASSAGQIGLLAAICAALAGPVISLVQGSIAGGLLASRKSNRPLDLLLLWMSLLGFVNFFGYLMLTPLSTKGDTGKVAELLQMPFGLRIAIAVIGIAVLIVIVLKLGRSFARFIPVEAEIPARRRYVNAVLLFPIMIGSGVNVLLAFPVVSVLSIIYPATSAYVLMSAYGKILTATDLHSSDSPVQWRYSSFLVVIAGMSILANRLLTIGVSLIW